MATNITIGGVTITPEELEILAAAVVSEIETTSKEPSEYELVETVDGVTSLPAFKQTGSTFTLVRVLTSLLKGADGKQIELRANATHLQWRLLNTGAWMDLLPIEVLQQPAADAIELYGTEIQQLMATKFDAVEKRDDGLWFLADGVEVAGPIEAGGGGGSGGGIGGGSVLRLINLGSSSVGVAAGSPVVLNYTFESKDSETDDPTGDGTVAYFVNNIKIATRTVQQGANSFDVTGYLNAGSNTVRIQATDSYGAMRSLNINVMVVSLSLTSTFNDSVAYSSAIVFPYTPVGSGSKTVHFVLNGTEVGTVVTTATNRQLTYNLPALTHGAHLLEVFATMDVQGVQLASNVLQYSIIFVENNNNAVIISSVFGQTEAVQYDTLAIPFQVYNPAGQTSAVELKVNGAVVSSLTVDRTRQTWSYRIPASGTLELQIASGSASRTFNLTVENSSIDSEAETAGLELFLTSNGRSNNETNREEWISLPPTPSEGGGVAATLTGFNWKTNGWVLDGDSVTVLRVNAGASVSIPYKPFQSDFKGTGKTVEFEFSVRNVEDFGDTVIQCWSGNRGFRISANGILFSSALSSLSAKFKEEEIIRVSIVVQSIFTQRLILLYLNGIMSGAQVYSVNDDFSQASPVNITIGSPLATVDLYNIRAYNTELNAMQILNNYIADLANVAKKLAVFDRNQVYDSTGDIVYSEIVQQIPCMTIIGDLPTFKGDKKTVQIVFENRQNPEKSFTSTGVTIDVQGTSSQYYPRKNYKTNHKSGFLMTESNETLAEYQINPDNVPGSVLCSKTDYAESSGTHNTGMARFVNDLLKNMNVLTPAQILDGRVRTTVDGYPITMFHRATANDPLMFVGKYNMNYDKDSQAVFGFTSPPNPSPFGEGSPECWEFLNNTSDRSLFKSADFSGSDWQNDFEARFPDGFTDKTNVEILFQWVVSCIGNPNKFKTELEQHFNKNNILTYYLLTEMFGMVDQRAKNQFLTSWGNEGTGEYKWYFIFYDNDTSFGINNEGMIAFPYSIETEDVIGSGHVWNGWDSELWKLVKSAYTDEIAVMYAQMRSSLMTYAAVSHILNEEQSAKWCEVVYNLDGQYKYIQPLIEDGNGSYLYALQGSRLEHRKWWLSNRFMYMDSRYNAADFLNDYITMRIYTPATWQGVEPDADFSLTLFKDSYVRVKYGSYVFAQRGTAGQTVLVEAPDIQFNDTETIVYGVSSVQSLGSLAAKYPGTVDISNAKKLTELIIGSPGAPPNPPEGGASGYSNENLTHVSVGNNLMLKKVDVRNCPNLTEPLDLSGCVNLEEVYAEGTNISMVVLPEAGVLHTLHLPASIVNLTLKNQTNLSPNPSPQGEGSGLVLAGTENIATLVLENMNQIEPWELLKSILSPLRGLNRVRLIGIDAEDSDLETLRTVAGLQGVDEHGLATARAVVTGKIFISGDIYQSEVDELNGVFPELEISGNILSDPVTTFTFTSNKSGETLGGTSFLCSHPFVKIDGTTFAVTAAPGTVISFTFSADKHQDRTANYTVTTSRTQGYSVIYLPLVTFTFRKTDNTPLEGVIASPQPPPKEGETLVSDANGQISFRATGLITGTAEHDYGKASINVTVSGQNDQAFTVVLQPFVQVRLRAIVENVPVRGAAITFNGQTYGTDYNGFTPSIRASAGSYESSCTYQGKMKTFGVYVGLSDSFTEVSMNNMQIAFSQMDFGEPDGSIQVILNTASAITVNSTNANYVIDWGEGKETAATGTGSQSYTPPAGLQQVKFVKIRNCGGITAMTFPAYSVMALLSVGDSKLDYAVTYGLSSSTFNNAFSNLRVTGSDVFKAGMAKPSVDFGSAFASRTSLLFVQAHLFDGLNVTNFQQAFHGCSLAESIPEGLFRDAVNCKNFNSAFFSFGNGNLAGLTLDPQDLFPAVPDANIGNLFNSSAIKRVRESLLAPFVSVISATAVFQNCTKLETAVIPAQIPVQANFFNGCTALEWVEFKHAAPFVLDASVFGNTNGTFVIYVPDSAVAAYKAEASWSGFVSRILPASQKTV